MYHHVRGKLIRLTPGEAIVEAGGIGYCVEISFPTYESLESCVGEEVLLYLLPSFREESQRLFGFTTGEAREFFRILLAVRGFGPSHALALLSGLSLAELHEAITDDKPEILRRVRGIGRRNAERLIVELREKLPPVDRPAEETDEDVETARLALQGLGYSRDEAVAAVAKAKKAVEAGGAAEWIRYALQTR